VGETPLYLAIQAENMNVIQLLLQNDANPNCCTDYGSALHAAVLKKNESIVKELLLSKADVNAGKPSSPEDTPLKIAIGQGYEPMIKYLLKWLPSRENLFIGVEKDILKQSNPDLYNNIIIKNKSISCYSFSQNLIKFTTNSLAYQLGIRDDEINLFWWFKEETEDKALNAKNAIVCVSLDESAGKLDELKLLKKGKKCENLLLIGCPAGFNFPPLKKFIYEFYINLSPMDIAGIWTKFPEDVLKVFFDQIDLVNFLLVSKSCFYLAFPRYFTQKYNIPISYNSISNEEMKGVAKIIGAKYFPFVPEQIAIEVIKIIKKKKRLGLFASLGGSKKDTKTNE